MIQTYCEFVGPGPGQGPVAAVQDSFGKQFRCLRSIRHPGEIGSVQMKCDASPYRAMSEDLRAVNNFLVIRKVHPNTVYAVLRRAGRGALQLKRGYWYEVHGD